MWDLHGFAKQDRGLFFGEHEGLVVSYITTYFDANPAPWR